MGRLESFAIIYFSYHSGNDLGHHLGEKLRIFWHHIPVKTQLPSAKLFIAGYSKKSFNYSETWLAWNKFVQKAPCSRNCSDMIGRMYKQSIFRFFTMIKGKSITIFRNGFNFSAKFCHLLIPFSQIFMILIRYLKFVLFFSILSNSLTLIAVEWWLARHLLGIFFLILSNWSNFCLK